MKKIIRAAARAIFFPAILATVEAHAALNDEIHECKFVHNQQGIDACTKLFTEIKVVDGGTAWVYFGRGSDYLTLGQYPQALTDLNEAIKEAPAYSDAFINRASVYTHMGKLRLAKADLDTAVALHTTYVQVNDSNPYTSRYRATPTDIARMSRAQVEVELGDLPDAVIDADTAKMRAPDNPDMEMTACWVHAVKGDQLDIALADCNDAVDATPDNAAFLYRRGLVRYRMNDFAGAVKDLDQSLTIAPKDASAIYLRGLAKAKTGDAAGSKADMDAAATLYPNVAAFFAHYGIT
jgi:tetratricopeptide (TPR) repeat protein